MPGLNIRAWRPSPNCADSCSSKIWSTVPWMSGVDGSKTWTLGPRSPCGLDGTDAGARFAVHLELPERVAVLGGALGAGQPDVPGVAAQRDGLGAALAVGGGVRGAPALAVLGELDLVALGVGGLPLEDDLGDGGLGPQVDLEPLRVAVGAGPARRGVAVDCEGGGGAVVLLAGGGDVLVLRDERGRRLRRGRREHDQRGGGERARHQRRDASAVPGAGAWSAARSWGPEGRGEHVGSPELSGCGGGRPPPRPGGGRRCGWGRVSTGKGGERLGSALHGG